MANFRLATEEEPKGQGSTNARYLRLDRPLAVRHGTNEKPCVARIAHGPTAAALHIGSHVWPVTVAAGSGILDPQA